MRGYQRFVSCFISRTPPKNIESTNILNAYLVYSHFKTLLMWFFFIFMLLLNKSFISTYLVVYHCKVKLYTVDPEISRRQISGRFSFRTICLRNRFLKPYIVSFIRNSAFRIRTVCFYHKMHFYVIFWFTYPEGRFWWQVSVHSGQRSWAGC